MMVWIDREATKFSNVPLVMDIDAGYWLVVLQGNDVIVMWVVDQYRERVAIDSRALDKAKFAGPTFFTVVATVGCIDQINPLLAVAGVGFMQKFHDACRCIAVWRARHRYGVSIASRMSL